MSKRSSIMDDKTISEMILKNIKEASQMNIQMSNILNTEQMRLLMTYKEIYNYEPCLSFFLSLAILSHFSQGSFYTHYASPDRRPVQLYLWLVGSSGSGKTHAFRQLEKAISKTEKMFPLAYLKPVVVNGKPTESDLSSIITHTNHIGLRQHLSSNNKILLNDDADLIAESYGLYNVNDYTKEHERNIILCGYDGFVNSSRTTGTTIINIDDKRLTIAIATTGGKLFKNMKNWINLTGFDGSHNRFLYMSIPKLAYSRPQDFQVNRNSKKNPTFSHLCVIIHLFGTVRYVFEMSEAERAKFYGASFDQSLKPPDADEQTQSTKSAMFLLWNFIADLIETQDQMETQQQIADFYGKAGTTFPRLACLMQMYFNAAEILERVKDFVDFAEGDNQDLIINENLIQNVHAIIKKDYYKYDKSYLPRTNINQEMIHPMVIVKKEALLAAWTWYEYQLNIAAKLFTIDPDFANKITISRTSISHKPKTLKQLIMYLDFNIFPLSAISVKHPITGQTGIIKNRPALGERALQELLKDNLLKYNYFLTDARGRNIKSYMKTPIPPTDHPSRDLFLSNLLKHDIDIDEYSSIYEKSSIPSNNNLSKLTLEIFEHNACFINQYSKYKSQLSFIIEKHINNCCIQEIEENFIIQNSDVFNGEFANIENLILGAHSQQVYNNRQTMSTINQMNKPIVEHRHTTTNIFNTSCDIIEKGHEMQHHHLPEQLHDQRDTNIQEILVAEERDPSEDINSPSTTTFESQNNIGDESSNAPTQQTVKEITNTYKNGTEQMIKKAMQNIMTGKSVVFTKTDLTQICNKSNIRLEAVKRLLTANLLVHGKNYWVEPNRSKKDIKKNPKRIFREGWLKNVPDSDSSTSKFLFIQSLQENLNLSYDDYLKSFYPNQEENVFTHNNWTLSDELIEIFTTNFFYKEHVRWNNERYGSHELIGDKLNIDNQSEIGQTSTSQVNDPERISIDDNRQGVSLPQLIVDHDQDEEITHTQSRCIRKRKLQVNENLQDIQTRSQSRKMKKY